MLVLSLGHATTVANLVNCLECGKQVSSAARMCPSCGTPYPCGRLCVICFRVGKASDGVETRSDDEPRWVDSFCYDIIQHEYHSVSHTCPTCQNVEACYKWSVSDKFQCRKCGHPIDTGYWVTACSHCGGPVFPIAFDNTWTGTHRGCVASARYEYEQKIARQSKFGCFTSLLLLMAAVTNR